MSLRPAEKPVVAVFDFDGTLTRRDTLLPFLISVAGPTIFIRHMLQLVPVLIAYRLGLMRNDLAKQRVLRRFLCGMASASLQSKAQHFATSTVPQLLRPEAMQRLQWHQRQGHRCIVISASLQLYVEPWASAAGCREVLATELEVRVGQVTGNINGENCFGSEKVRRLEALLGDRGGYILYAYGDSRGDRELLASADHAYYRNFPANPE
ncbi:MAG: HAD family hydrolase [Pseudomonadota bacterium]